MTEYSIILAKKNCIRISYEDEMAGFVLLNSGKYVPKDIDYREVIEELDGFEVYTQFFEN